ncbi:MAG TPA: RidA family protein [Gemmatimonadaceae bacterium]|nr:RidA family protein [Gemmatimonadaceae bacterium]
MRFAPSAAAAVVVLCCCAITLLGGCKSSSPEARRAAAAPAPEYLTPYGPPAYPFSPAVRVGPLLYLAGQIGTDSTGHVVPGGIEPETRRAMANIRDVLARTGSSLDRVVKCTVMMADMREWPAMNAVYATYFPVHKPARSAFGTTGLALGARVEIECIAAA